MRSWRSPPCKRRLFVGNAPGRFPSSHTSISAERLRRNEILRGREHLTNGCVNARRGFRVNRVVVPCTGTLNQCFVPRVRSENHLLKPVADNLVVTGQQEDRRGMDSSGVGDAVQFVRNPPRERNSQKPEIPPPVLPDNELLQRRWVLKEHSCNTAISGHVKSCGCSKAGAKHKNRL